VPQTQTAATTASSREVGIPEDRYAALVALEEGVTAVVAGAREGLRRQASSVHPDLPPSAIVVLRKLEEFGPMTPGALAARLQVANSAISRVTRQLGQLGLVKVTLGETDRRLRIIGLTPEAVARLKAVGPGGVAQLDDRLRDWETEDVLRLVGYLARLAPDSQPH
jgi:DNA-binding MarR family transcriptional regulator